MMGDQIFLSLNDERSEFYRWSDDRLAQVAIERKGEGFAPRFHH